MNDVDPSAGAEPSPSDEFQNGLAYGKAGERKRVAHYIRNVWSEIPTYGWQDRLADAIEKEHQLGCETRKGYACSCTTGDTIEEDLL